MAECHHNAACKLHVKDTSVPVPSLELPDPRPTVRYAGFLKHRLKCLMDLSKGRPVGGAPLPACKNTTAQKCPPALDIRHTTPGGASYHGSLFIKWPRENSNWKPDLKSAGCRQAPLSQTVGAEHPWKKKTIVLQKSCTKRPQWKSNTSPLRSLTNSCFTLGAQAFC